MKPDTSFGKKTFFRCYFGKKNPIRNRGLSHLFSIKIIYKKMFWEAYCPRHNNIRYYIFDQSCQKLLNFPFNKIPLRDGIRHGAKARNVVAITSCPMSSKAPRAFCEPTGAPAEPSLFSLTAPVSVSALLKATYAWTYFTRSRSWSATSASTHAVDMRAYECQLVQFFYMKKSACSVESG
jgi:hypothetical protein